MNAGVEWRLASTLGNFWLKIMGHLFALSMLVLEVLEQATVLLLVEAGERNNRGTQHTAGSASIEQTKTLVRERKINNNQFQCFAFWLELELEKITEMKDFDDLLEFRFFSKRNYHFI